MATKQSTVDFISDQISGAGLIQSRKMFGEYALYCDSKVVALICDDQLFVKPTVRGRDCIDRLEEGQPYPGAKPYYLISEEYWDDREFLTKLIAETAAELPLPKPKRTK